MQGWSVLFVKHRLYQVRSGHDTDRPILVIAKSNVFRLADRWAWGRPRAILGYSENRMLHQQSCEQEASIFMGLGAVSAP
jgi:hypothetical protein